MMLRVFLLATLLVVAFADHHEEDDDHDGGFDHITDQYGCCSHEDRREIQYLWQSIWESSFTERKIMIAKAIFEESVIPLHLVITVIINIINMIIIIIFKNFEPMNKLINQRSVAKTR